MSKVLTDEPSASKTKASPNCPNCSSEFVQRVRRTTVYERLVSLFYIYPFNCQLCGQGFSLFQPGVRYVRVDEDQRAYQRIRVDLPIVMTHDEIERDGSAIDISMRGCTVRTDDPLGIGSIIKVALKIPNEKDTLTVEAIVRNSSADRVGLEFLRFQGRERQRLRQFVQSLLSAKYQ
jgi:hypothetical protein